MRAGPADPRRTVYLHIGLHKTGTTYLQGLMRANRERMREQGVEYPGSAGGPAQSLAVWDLQGGRPGDSDDKRIPGSWAAIVDAIHASPCERALISVEWLSLSSVKQVRRAVRSFTDAEVHVIVTVRDLGRVAVSAWQEEIKNEQTWTWSEFVAGIKDPDRLALNPARGFWLRQDVLRVCEKWETAVPAERIHIVTVPHPPTPTSELLARFAGVVGFDPRLFTEEPAWTNETIGVAATEVIRRLNIRLGGRLNRRMHGMLVKGTLSPMLGRRTDPVRFTLPLEEYGWVTERAEAMISGLRERGYPIVGDLDELRPRPRDGRRPDDASDEELLEASLDALALLSERFAKAWWQRKAPDEPAESSLRSRTRGLVFRGRRKAAEVAGRSPTAVKAMTAVVRSKDRVRPGPH
jgi:hypothetical protein